MSTDSKCFFSLLLSGEICIDYNSTNLKIDAITLSWVILLLLSPSSFGIINLK